MSKSLAQTLNAKTLDTQAQFQIAAMEAIEFAAHAAANEGIGEISVMKVNSFRIDGKEPEINQHYKITHDTMLFGVHRSTNLEAIQEHFEELGFKCSFSDNTLKIIWA